MLRDIRIASPCKADWNHMVGDDRVRHCAECNLNVYNFSAMSRAEVHELIANHEERLCARLYQRRDGTILTKDCPVGFQMKVRRVSRAAGAALVAIMGVAGAAAQTAVAPVTSATADRKQEESQLNLRVLDASGGVIPGAKIQILDKSGVERATGITDREGKFKANLPPGVYTLSVEFSGFENPRQTIQVGHNETVEVYLMVDSEHLEMGVIAQNYDMRVEPETMDVPSKIEPSSPAVKKKTAAKTKTQ